jgi:hypothetical protein
MKESQVFLKMIQHKNKIVSIGLSSKDKSFYAEINNDFIQNIDIRNNLEFKDFLVIIDKVNNNKIHLKNTLNNVLIEISEWILKFDTPVVWFDKNDFNEHILVNNIINVKTKQINKVLKEKARPESFVKLSDADTTRDFYHALCDAKVLENCYEKYIR